MSERCDPAHEYAKDVLKGKYRVGREILQLAKIHADQIENSNKYGFTWDTAKADIASNFFSEILTLDSGEPFNLQPFQQFQVRRLYALRKKATGQRVIDTWYFEAGKAAGKSRLAAGVALTELVVCGRKRPERAYLLPAKLDQKSEIFSFCLDFIQNSPDYLGNLLKVYGGDHDTKSIYYPSKRIEFKAVASHVGGVGKSGQTTALMIFEEFSDYAYEEAHQRFLLGTKGARDPLALYLTNAGTDFLTPCGTLHQRAKAILDGEIQEHSTMPVIYALDDTDDPFKDPDCLEKAGPLLIYVPALYDYVLREKDKSQASETKRSMFERLNCSRWGMSENPWLRPERWESVFVREDKQPSGWLEEREEARKDATCYVAVDLSQSNDLTAATFIWDFGHYYETKTHIWTHAGNIEQREITDTTPYRNLEKKGYINIMETDYIDPAVVAHWLAEKVETYNVKGMILDTFNRKDFLNALKVELGTVSDRPYEDPKLAYVGVQTGPYSPVMWMMYKNQPPSDRPAFSISSCLDISERLVIGEKVSVTYSPLLDTSIRRTVIAHKHDMRTMERKIGEHKIDPAVTLCMAMGMAETMKNYYAANTNRNWVGVA